MFNDKINSSIAEAAKRCMDEELKGNQHKIDANKNGKIDADDFKKLRKEETIDEAKYEPAEPDPELIAKRKAREEAQRRREEKAERDADDLSKDYKPKATGPATKKVAGKAYGGAAQKDETNESVKSFSGLLESYKEGGIKSLFESLQKEEASEEEFNAELKKQKDKAEGKAPQAKVAAASTQGVEDVKEEVELTLEDYSLEEIEQYMMSEEYEQLDEISKDTLKSYVKKAAVDAGTNQLKMVRKNKNDTMKVGAPKEGPDYRNIGKQREKGISKALDKLTKEEVEDLEERTLTSAETAEKERVVKGMKKGIEGFKQRYGSRAKEVLYATATARAKED